MSHDAPGYGLWFLVIFNSAIFIMFAFSFSNQKQVETGEVSERSLPLSLLFLLRCTVFR